ncbi:TIGR02206 family membrane protein [Halobacillus yeomjeoni]|uniref:TIGR02206 family membrane protein n=1 Tax=Halobacillus yeomjeoni TaxID=311194 RepID=A0A931MV76_9BACI|nr:TIGR02206 family membrane protein [Halobacillus yeomjeoni]MBH0230532.1 TIGR02206 family membrane protein [Halobacillus yeomjeoni]
MPNWITPGSESPFQLFSQSHVSALVLFIFGLCGVGILALKSRKRSNGNVNNAVRWTLLGILIVSELSYQIWAFAYGLWEVTAYLPLHLCSVASLLGIVSLITMRPSLIKINFFIGILPAIFALVTPDLLYDYQHYRFWRFFLHHMAIPWTSLFLVISTSATITWKDMWKTFGMLIAYASIVGFLNVFLQSNYLYLRNPPNASTLLNWFGEGWWYIISLTLITLICFSLLVVIFRIVNKS